MSGETSSSQPPAFGELISASTFYEHQAAAAAAASSSADADGAEMEDEGKASRSHDCSGHSHSHSHSHQCHHSHGETHASAESSKESGVDEEAKQFQATLNALRQYERHSLAVLRHLRQQWERIPDRHKTLVQDFGFYFDNVASCIRQNQLLLNEIAAPHRLFENEDSRSSTYQMESSSTTVAADGGGQERRFRSSVSEAEMDKVRSTVRQFVRDWSTEGAAERDQCYGPVLRELDRRFGNAEDKSAIHVLVPGAGLARLAFEVAKRGYSCQGNEFSFQMLLASDFLLNRCKRAMSIFPFVHQTTNVLSREDAVREVSIPDEFPGNLSLGPSQKFTMVAGDFLEVYGAEENHNRWDVIVTCFFIDTAHNVFEYIETIQRCLRNNGVWINFGPLLYHFAESKNEASVELPLSDLLAAIPKMGFRLESQELSSAVYTTNIRSMLRVNYTCSFFCATKQSSS